MGPSRFGLLSLVPCAVLIACSSPSEPLAPRQQKRAATTSVSVSRLLPLLAGSVLAYDTLADDTGERGVLMMEIKRPREGRVDVVVGGKVQRLETTSDGVRYVSGGYLLQEPLREGRTWPGNIGTVTVTRVDTLLDTPAGSFRGCLETVEEAAKGTARQRITTTFCPDVGICQLAIEAATDGELRSETATLRSFAQRVDVYSLEQ